MKRPLVWILLFFIAGIVMGRYFNEYIALFFAVVVLMTFVVFLRFRINIVLCFPIAALVGFAIIFTRIPSPDPNMEALLSDSHIVTLTGRATDIGETRSGNTKAIIQAQTITSLNGNQAKTNMKIMAYFDESIKISHGDTVILGGELLPPDFLRNYGGFDEKKYFALKDITYKIFAEEYENTGNTWGLDSIIAQIREKLSSTFDKILPQKESGIMKAMIIGDKSGLDEDTKDLFKQAGIYHILAVSGLHVSLLAVFLDGILSRFLNNRRAGIVLMLFLVFYCILTGCGVATVRAVIMYCIGVFGRILYKDTDSITSTSFAALCILLFQPLYLWDVGFQYSFAVVYGLIIGTRAIAQLFDIIKTRVVITQKFFDNKFIKTYLAGAIAATLASIPITVYYFYNLSLITTVLNLFIIPTVFIVVLCGFFICIVGLIAPLIASYIAILCVLMLQLYELLCNLCLMLPFSNILTGQPPLYIIVMYCITLCIGYYVLYAKKSRASFDLIKNVFAASFCVLVLSLVATEFLPRDLEVCMLDVGQGDSIVINKGRSAFFIDGGGEILKGIGNNTGRNVLVPYLDYKGIDVVEAAFVSHLDFDHAGGVIETMERKTVKKLFLPYPSKDDITNENLNQLLKLSQKNNTEVYYISSGDEMLFNESIQIKCIYPDKIENTKTNEASEVLKIIYGSAQFIFTGDIDTKTEKKILESGSDINADVLKVAHHGSKYSSSWDFINGVSPSIAIVSAGRNNTYGHPTPEVLNRLNQSGRNVFSTVTDGAITLKTDGSAIFVKTMKPAD